MNGVTNDWPESAVVFECDGEQSVAILHAATTATHEVGILVVVGGPQYRIGSHRQFVLMARHFAGAGYPVLRFDYRGMGDSSGHHRTFDAVDQDIRAAIDAFLSATPHLKSVVVLGLCDAASAALMYCHRDSRVAGLILMNPWSRNVRSEARAFVRHYYFRRLVQRAFWVKVVSGEFRLFGAATDFYDKLRRSRTRAGRGSSPEQIDFFTRMVAGAKAFTNPVLLLLSDNDLTAREFEDNCRASPVWSGWLRARNVEKVTVLDADHTFSKFESLESASNSVLRWLSKAFLMPERPADHRRAPPTGAQP